jgi:hypothetical protein
VHSLVRAGFGHQGKANADENQAKANPLNLGTPTVRPSAFFPSGDPFCPGISHVWMVGELAPGRAASTTGAITLAEQNRMKSTKRRVFVYGKLLALGLFGALLLP